MPLKTVLSVFPIRIRFEMRAPEKIGENRIINDGYNSSKQ